MNDEEVRQVMARRQYDLLKRVGEITEWRASWRSLLYDPFVLEWARSGMQCVRMGDIFAKILEDEFNKAALVYEVDGDTMTFTETLGSTGGSLNGFRWTLTGAGIFNISTTRTSGTFLIRFRANDGEGHNVRSPTFYFRAVPQTGTET